MRIVVFWDSISEWFWDYENGWWVNRLKIDYWKKYWYEKIVMNYGISAYTSENLVNCFDSFFSAVSKREPGKEKESIVVFAIGINDSSEVISTWDKRVSIDRFRENIQTLINKCQSEVLIRNVVCVWNINVNESVINNSEDGEHHFYNKDIQEYNSVLKKLAEKTTCSYIDLFWLMENDDLEDGLHPNANGHKKICEVIKRYLK